jgi:hypothetical protein
MDSSVQTALGKANTALQTQAQADWSQTTSSAPDYIKNKPTIPSEVTESTVAGWGFTKNTGDYSKPATGIPSTDLSSDVQTSLGNADSAYQKPSAGIPASDLASDVIPDVTNFIAKSQTTGLVKNDGTIDTNTYLTSHQDISGKVDKATSATANHLASFVSGGGIQDSGYKIVTISSSDYESLATKDANTIYLVS